MPPRPVSLAIVAFWLAAMGWLFARDLWPAIRPGERPPFTIDLDKEVTRGPGGPVWSVHRKGVRIGYANSSTRFNPADQTYLIHTDIRFENFKFSVLRLDFEVTRMHSDYRVTRDGELREVQCQVVIDLHPGAQTIKIDVHGQVHDRLFSPRWSVRSPLGNQEFETDPVEVTSHDSILNPLQPWNRLLNVTPGRRGHTALFSPLTDSLGSVLPGKRPGVRRLEAGVLKDPEEMSWDNRDVMCLVIEYREPGGSEPVARTYVRQDDGLVLRQEATLQGDHMSLVREPR